MRAITCFNSVSDSNGRMPKAEAAIQGECSYKPSSRRAASPAGAALSCSRVSAMSAWERMNLLPVPCDVDAPADPDAIVPLHVIEKALQRDDAAGPPEQAAMHADAEHLRPRVTLGIERIEAVAQIDEEIVGLREAL